MLNLNKKTLISGLKVLTHKDKCFVTSVEKYFRMHGKQTPTKKKEITGSFHNFTQMTQPFDRSGSSELFLVKGFRIFMVLLYGQTLQFFFFLTEKHSAGNASQ